MPDVVVTLPKSFELEAWIDEGDPAGSPRWSGQEWHFYLGRARPSIQEGERCYVVYNGKLRGYAPLVRLDFVDGWRWALVRHSGAVAVTLPTEYIQGFRGFRYRWWDQSLEVPFPEWRNPWPGKRMHGTATSGQRKPVKRASASNAERPRDDKPMA